MGQWEEPGKPGRSCVLAILTVSSRSCWAAAEDSRPAGGGLRVLTAAHAGRRLRSVPAQAVHLPQQVPRFQISAWTQTRPARGAGGRPEWTPATPRAAGLPRAVVLARPEARLCHAGRGRRRGHWSCRSRCPARKWGAEHRDLVDL